MGCNGFVGGLCTCLVKNGIEEKGWVGKGRYRIAINNFSLIAINNLSLVGNNSDR